jgi:hypothetical protein
MPATHRSFGFQWSSFRFAIVIMLPLSTALGGCVALPLLALAGSMPTAQSAACATGTSGGTAPACNTGSTGSMIPGVTSLMQVLSAPAQPSR